MSENADMDAELARIRAIQATRPRSPEKQAEIDDFMRREADRTERHNEELRRITVPSGRIVLVDIDDPNDDATFREALETNRD
jgi:hypothetical protein